MFKYGFLCKSFSVIGKTFIVDKKKKKCTIEEPSCKEKEAGIEKEL